MLLAQRAESQAPNNAMRKRSLRQDTYLTSWQCVFNGSPRQSAFRDRATCSQGTERTLIAGRLFLLANEAFLAFRVG